MVVLGGKPEGRHTEQHDVFFGIAETLKDLVPEMNRFWPELAGRMHIDSWRKVSQVQNYHIAVVPKSKLKPETEESSSNKLFFVNLGGYKPEDMEEYHYKQLVVANSLAEATNIAKASTFWKHHNSSHIDDKYGIDVDDIYEIQDLLDADFKSNYHLEIMRSEDDVADDKLEIGYLKISKLLSWD